MADASDTPEMGPPAQDAGRLHALYQATRALHRAATTAELYRALLAGICVIGDCGTAACYTIRAGASSPLLALADNVGAGQGPPTIPLGPEALARLSETRIGPAHEFLGPASTALAAALCADQVALVAITGAGRAHAALALGWAEGATPPHGWEAAALALAEDAGLAFDRCSVQGALEHEEAFGRLTTAVNTITDIGLLYSNVLDRLLGAIVTQIVAVLRLSGGALYLYNDKSEQIELAVWARGTESAYGPDPAALWEGPLLASSLAQARELVRFSRPVLTLEAARGDQQVKPGLARGLQQLGIENMVSVPLLAGGWLTGVLQVTAPPGGRITEHEAELLQVLARQTAVAIENARLFAQTRADQERTRAVVDATNDAILMLDEHRRPLMVNRRARFFFGLTERDLVGKSLEQLGSLFSRIFEDGARFTGWLAQLLRSQSERAVEEFSIMSPEPRLLQCYSAPVTDLHDRYLGRLLVFRDITREREVERMKNDFVSIVSHELRTPLTSIQGALQLVLGQPEQGRPGMAQELAPQGRELLSISLSNTERLIRLINDILDIAKIEQGRVQLRREALAPEELCRSGAAAMGAFANDRGISMELRVDPQLPLVLADRDRSAQVLINLLSNAIKFSQPGQRVKLSAQQDGGMVCFTVRDWGRGIPLDEQSRLFQKFQQLDSSATRDVGGTGLGLAISKALVEEHGGRMWLESKPGHGSRFSFTLPLAPGAQDVEVKPRPESFGALTGSQQSELRHVLVVDDDASVRSLFVRMLQRHGLLVSNASNGYEALSLAAQQRPDVILLDYKMPGLDGFEVLRRLKGQPATAAIPVIILTADELSQSAREYGLDLGARIFLDKPIAAERLINSVMDAIRREEEVG
jgi:PAS domain S-box-containing protein